MGLFSFLFNLKEKDIKEEIQGKNDSNKQEFPILKEKTCFSYKTEEECAYFEYIDFKVAGTSHYQKEIKKAIKIEREDGWFGDPYNGMTNKEIMEDTFDEPIFQYQDEIITDCHLELEENNEYDPEAITVYVKSLKVGYIPKRKFAEGKKYIYKLMKDNREFNLSVSLYGGRYKINRADEEIETGISDYKLNGQIVIKNAK